MHLATRDVVWWPGCNLAGAGTASCLATALDAHWMSSGTSRMSRQHWLHIHACVPCNIRAGGRCWTGVACLCNTYTRDLQGDSERYIPTIKILRQYLCTSTLPLKDLCASTLASRRRLWAVSPAFASQIVLDVFSCLPMRCCLAITTYITCAVHRHWGAVLHFCVMCYACQRVQAWVYV